MKETTKEKVSLTIAGASAETEEDERLESDAWRRTMEEDSWDESPDETSDTCG